MTNKLLKYTLTGASLGVMMAFGAQSALACSPNYKGKTLTIVTQTGPYIASALVQAGKSWKKKTCGDIKVVEYPWSELYPKIVTTLTSGSSNMDMFTFAPAWAPDFMPFLNEMPAEHRKGDVWNDVAEIYREQLMVWNGKVLSQTMDGDTHTYSYRIDLFEDPKHQKAFKAKYGYKLMVPDTWKKYLDIAEYFNNDVPGIAGTTEAFRRGGQSFWFFFSHAAAYAHHPDMPGSMFFDPDTMDAQINNPGWVRALEEYIRASKLAPAGALNYASGDARTAFTAGKAPQAFGWADDAILGASGEESVIPNGKVGSGPLPGSDEIWNYKTKKWDKFKKPVQTSFMAFGGWQIAVPQAGKQKQMAWEFSKHLSSPEVSQLAAITAGTGVNPYRISHTTNMKSWRKIFTEREAKEYLDSQKAALESPNVALDMRLNGYFSYTEVLEIELSRALNGEVSAKEALDRVAKEWNKLTDQFGRDAQKAAYRASMGL